MSENNPLSELIDILKLKYQWWKAETYGERPTCESEDCEHDAKVYLNPEGYRCFMCYHRGQPYQGVGFMRSIEPSDYFRTEDDAE